MTKELRARSVQGKSRFDPYCAYRLDWTAAEAITMEVRRKDGEERTITLAEALAALQQKAWLLKDGFPLAVKISDREYSVEGPYFAKTLLCAFDSLTGTQRDAFLGGEWFLVRREPERFPEDPSTASHYTFFLALGDELHGTVWVSEDFIGRRQGTLDSVLKSSERPGLDFPRLVALRQRFERETREGQLVVVERRLNTLEDLGVRDLSSASLDLFDHILATRRAAEVQRSLGRITWLLVIAVALLAFIAYRAF